MGLVQPSSPPKTQKQLTIRISALKLSPNLKNGPRATLLTSKKHTNTKNQNFGAKIAPKFEKWASGNPAHLQSSLFARARVGASTDWALISKKACVLNARRFFRLRSGFRCRRGGGEKVVGIGVLRAGGACATNRVVFA